MYEVRVTAEFAAAHFLRDYHGKCERLHGHNYTVYAHVRGAELDAGGMLMDFAVLKGALKTVAGSLDHTNLNDNPAFAQNPSAERIARFIYDRLCAVLAEQGIDVRGKNGGAVLCAVDVFETATSRARYIPDGCSCP
ncbi:MAG: 6-carboxytetrahydropterin synthase QueD [Treponemataceae bacterium]|nr:6-carboxytetrahydropterin synthase QueD [Treponemataceae bacterium]